MALTDKHGKAIKAGMILRNDNGHIQKVYRGETESGKPTLGFKASKWEIYPLHQFDLKEWEIVGGEEIRNEADNENESSGGTAGEDLQPPERGLL